ncbi:hypothetical protein F511_23220 [Dorcoceras hygrometricum]|uniref:Uncharacterized protein n=1 Tax=Dorcoceras hygrometricum TaxID=472368 RepID=A0A2Z7BKE9_9LAMI|nr:hypothetical protein F511_23220 [Dorcoceras hygrometricum]
MKRRRAEESADGLVLMMSSVTSSYSADGLKDQSQATVHQQMLFEESDSKTIGFIYKGSAIKEVFEIVGHCEDIAENKSIAQCTNKRENEKRKTKQSTAIREELSRESIAESRLASRRRKTLVYVVSHTVEAVVHLRSLGVLTAAGCGIGSVHTVVRSNLLVEPSEVEEGEIILRLDISSTTSLLSCDWMYKLPADSCDCSLKPSAEYDDVTDDVINTKPSADSSARRRFISFTSLHLLIANC